MWGRAQDQTKNGQEETCEFQPCRHWGKSVSIEDARSCRHGPQCQFAGRIEKPAPEPRDGRRFVKRITGGLALLALLTTLGVEAVLDARRTEPPRIDSPPPPSYDYTREVEELVSFSRQVLEKAEAIRVFEEQIADDFGTMPESTRERWAASSERKKEERNALCDRMVAKLGLLIRLDHDAVDREFRRLGSVGDVDIEGRREGKSVSLARKQWDVVKRTGNLGPGDLIASAEMLLPF